MTSRDIPLAVSALARVWAFRARLCRIARTTKDMAQLLAFDQTLMWITDDLFEVGVHMQEDGE